MSVDVVGLGENSVDIVYRLATWPRPGGATSKLPIERRTITPGGQVVTTLATCAALGLRTRYIGAIGNDENGAIVREALTSRGIDDAGIIVRGVATRYAVILVDESSGERVVLWERSASLDIAPDDIRESWITGARLLHVDGTDETAALAAAAIARRARIPVTSDFDRVTPRTEALLDAVTIPILAEHLPAAMTGESDPERALRRLRRPHHQMLCVTLGPHGALLLEGDRVHHAPGLPVDVVDSTGAGDVFRGAFIAAYLRGEPPADVLRAANQAAAASCTREGALGGVAAVAERRG